jgi:hypothetical protein
LAVAAAAVADAKVALEIISAVVVVVALDLL